VQINNLSFCHIQVHKTVEALPKILAERLPPGSVGCSVRLYYLGERVCFFVR